MRRGRSSIVVVMLALALGGVGQPVAAAPAAQVADRVAVSVAAADEPASAAFATPEEAIRAYLAGVADADVDAILAASAIDEMSEGYRFDLAVDRLRAFIPYTMLAPAEHQLYADINRAQRTDEILGQVLMLAYGLLSGETIDGSPITPVDKAWAGEFARRVDPARLAGITIEAISFADPELQQNERYLANAARQAAMYGADELTERVALFSFEGGSYLLGFTLLRYGDGWRVSSQSSALAGTDVLGTAEPVTAR